MERIDWRIAGHGTEVFFHFVDGHQCPGDCQIDGKRCNIFNKGTMQEGRSVPVSAWETSEAKCGIGEIVQEIRRG